MTICYVCTTDQECRPYGERGQMICFECMMADPAREAEAERQFAMQLQAAGPVVMIGEEVGPYPIQHATRPAQEKSNV